MQDWNTGAESISPLNIQAESLPVIGWNAFPVMPLVLDPQHHDDVDLTEHCIKVMTDPNRTAAWSR